MALREFADARGRRWTAWDVRPRHADVQHGHAHDHAAFRPSHREGWLAFECPRLREKRRLMPIPDDWFSLSEEALASLCDLAQVVLPTRRLLE